MVPKLDTLAFLAIPLDPVCDKKSVTRDNPCKGPHYMETSDFLPRIYTQVTLYKDLISHNHGPVTLSEHPGVSLLQVHEAHVD